MLPAIKSKWPSAAGKDIYIQQDNARPHIKDDDATFRMAASADGFNIRLVHQPPNSPDTNVNDLGWFRSIQSLQIQRVAHTVDDLVSAVSQSFEELSHTTLNKVFLSLQGCMIEIMTHKGHNDYKLPHMKKDTLIQEERLLINLEVPIELVRECIQYLVDVCKVEGIRGLMNDVGFNMITT